MYPGNFKAVSLRAKIFIDKLSKQYAFILFDTVAAYSWGVKVGKLSHTSTQFTLNQILPLYNFRQNYCNLQDLGTHLCQANNNRQGKIGKWAQITTFWGTEKFFHLP